MIRGVPPSMRDESKWTRRAKWIVSSVFTVLFMVLITTIILNTMQAVDVVNATTDNYPPESEAVVSVEPDSDDMGLPIEKASVSYLLKIEGYTSTIEDLPEIPSGCDSEVLARTISNLSGDNKVVLNLDHQMPRDLPAPSIVWISNGDDSYPVVFLYQDNNSVTVSDPSRGTVRYPIKEFEDIYCNAGSQSVFITDRGYIIN